MGKGTFALTVDDTKAVCAIGETAGKRSIDAKKIPVISCEGACIRGEIARLAAHLVAKETPYRRSCHGEMFTAPHSDIAQWMHEAENVVVIDGCFMKCHGRILRNLIDDEKLIQFDALSMYKKYTNLMSIDDVPEEERKATAREVAYRILDRLREGKTGLTAGGPFAKNEEASACSPR
jgi:uncharacterized metal-binding protein